MSNEAYGDLIIKKQQEQKPSSFLSCLYNKVLSKLLVVVMYVVRVWWEEFTPNVQCLVTSATLMGHPWEPVSDLGHSELQTQMCKFDMLLYNSRGSLT